MGILLRPEMVQRKLLQGLVGDSCPNLADYFAMRSSDCRDEGMLPALDFGVGQYDTVPANQGSTYFRHVAFLREVPA